MTRLLSSLLLVTGVLVASVLLSPSPALAQINQDPNAVPSFNSWQVKTQSEWERIVGQCDNPKNPQLVSECYAGPYSLANTLQPIVSITFGSTDGSSPGISGIITKLYALTLFSQPSSIDYLAYVGKNFGFSITRPAYAQGFGASQAVKPLIPLWSIFRNIAYIIFIVTFLIIGFMIMFRRKLDPQTVVGIQHALPRIIVALLLVTFSYAIVGFMIDLMLLLTNMVATILGNNFTFLDQPSSLANNNIFKLIIPITPLGKDLGQIIDNTIRNLFSDEFAGLGFLEGLSNITVKAVLGIAGVFVMFKIFFMLLASYVHIILSLILGPLQLSLSAIPGNKALSNWFLQLLSNILVFPITFALIFIASILISQTRINPGDIDWQLDTGAIWKQGKLAWAPPLIGTDFATSAGPLLAFGILFTIPTIASSIKAALEVKEGPEAANIKEQLRGGAGWLPFVGSLAQRVIS